MDLLIASLPFGHSLLDKTHKVKKEFKKEIHTHIHEIKDELLKEELCIK